MDKSAQRSTLRIAFASLAVVMAVASLPSGAGAATARPAAPTGTAPSETENFVSYVYRSALFREPDEGGFAYWTDLVERNGATPFVSAVVQSQEWREIWVSGFYQNWLGRVADESGLAHWTSYMAERRFDDFETELASSDEAYGASGGTDVDYIDQLYDSALFRAPTDVEAQAAAAELEAGRRTDLAYSLLHVDESLATRVEIVFELALHRTPDPDGATFWLGYYRSTGRMQLLLGHLLLSPEAWTVAQSNPTIADLRSLLQR
jgi:hypothetical protein